MNVFIHIGQPKTGSSTIQYFLSQNKSKLINRGYCYPDEKQGHHILAGAIRSKESKKATTIWNSYILEAEKQNCHTLILSSEVFTSLKRPRQFEILKNILIDHTPRFIVYLRPPEEKIENSFIQTLKSNGFAQSIEDFYKDNIKVVDYLAQLRDWTKHFKKGLIEIRPMEKGYLDDLRSDFLGCIGIQDLTGLELTGDKNIRPNIVFLKMLHLLSNSPLMGQLAEDKRKKLFAFLKGALRDMDTDLTTFREYRLLPRELALKIRADFAKDYQLINSDFRNKDEDLFKAEIPEYHHASLEFSPDELPQLAEILIPILNKIARVTSRNDMQGKRTDGKIKSKPSMDSFETEL